MRVLIVLLGLAPRLSALRILEEKGPPKGWAVRPIKAERRAGLERRETVRTLSTVFENIISCFWYEKERKC